MDFQEELKRRMALARKQGWKQDEIDRSALIERTLYSQREAAKQQQQQPQGAGRQGGWKGLALDLIPFGRVAEKAVNPNAGKITGGELLLEGALTALPFAGKFLGFGAKTAVKGAKAGGELLEGGAKVAAREGAEKAAEKSLPAKVGEIFRTPETPSGRVSNRLIKQGTIAPTSTLNSAREQEALLELVKTNPAFRGSAQRKFRNVGGEVKNMANQVDELFAGVTNKTTGKEFTRSINGVRKEIVDPLELKRFNIEFDRAVRTAFNGKLPKDLSPTEINQLRRAVNTQMSGIYKKVEKGTQLTDKDTAFLRLKDTLDDEITKLAPEEIRGQVQTLNRNMNTLIKGESEFKRASERGLPVIGNAAGVGPGANQALQSGLDLTGRGMRQAGRFVQAPAGKQVAVRAGAEVLGLRPDGTPMEPQQQGPQMPFADPANMNEAILNELSNRGMTTFEDLAQGFSDTQQMIDGTGMPGMQPGGQGGPTVPGLKYSSAELFNAAMEAMMAGDSKSANALQDMADQAMDMEEMFAEQSGGQGGGLNVTKPTADKFALAQSGMTALQGLEQLMQQDPGVVTRSATPGRGINILGIGSQVRNATGTGQFDALAFNAVDNMLRVLTGAQAPETEIRRYMNQYIPQAGDNDATKRQKMQSMYNTFNSILTLAQQPSSNDFEDEMSQLFAGQTNQYAY